MSEEQAVQMPEAGVASGLTDEQESALGLILEFLKGPKSYFLVKGRAGVGKTFLMQELARRIKGRVIFTAPTNKATRVLRQTLRSETYFPECRTIYSLLGLKLEADGEVKVLAHPEDPVDLTKYLAVVVDEGSMVNAALSRAIRDCASTSKVKFIFLGDTAQLPPVGEAASEIWTVPEFAELTRVIRHDNQILALATRIREEVFKPFPTLRFASDNAEGEGVWKHTGQELGWRIREAAEEGLFAKPTNAKVIAWRNATVDQYNALIRAAMFEEARSEHWLIGDRLIVTEPAKDFEGETLAHTDDEGTVQRVRVIPHPLESEFGVWALDVMLDENKLITLFTLHAASRQRFDARVKELADAARVERRKWKDYWAFKEMFHGARHGYAITAHRAQGSTYDTVFVDYMDILSNRNRKEAFQCLYVAATRPRKQLRMG